MSKDIIKKQVVRLRSQGKTFSEINNLLGVRISKSTLSNWCSGVTMSGDSHKRISDVIKFNFSVAREKAWEKTRLKKKNHILGVYAANLFLKKLLKRNTVARIALATLYLAEGAKKGSGCVMLGNSDPGIIKLFIYLMQIVFHIDKRKYRCTVQCRADQDIKKLESFWSEITGIPLSQFYGARIDKRTIGKRTVRESYRGVCRVDYLSSAIFQELMEIGKILTE